MNKKFTAPREKVSLFSVWSSIPVIQRIVLFVPLVVAIGMAVWLMYGVNAESHSSAQASKELSFTSDGYWDTFEEYNTDIWVPNDPAMEIIEDDSASYQKLHTTRDKGGNLEIAFGAVMIPETGGVNYDISADISNIITTCTPYLSSAIDLATNGIQSSFSVDNSITTLSNGQSVVVGQGTSSTMVMLQDPQNASNTWSEELSLNLYYTVVVFYNRPVLLWGVWDASTYEGENRTIASVSDAAISLMPTDGKEVVALQGDDFNTVSNDSISTEEPETSSWNEEQQAWISDQTGEVVDLPAPDDPYWNDKQVGDYEVTYGYEDEEKGWVTTDENGNILDYEYNTENIPDPEIELPN